jgi:hypothetical protein
MRLVGVGLDRGGGGAEGVARSWNSIWASFFACAMTSSCPNRGFVPGSETTGS